MKKYLTPEFEIINIKLTQDILSASQEETVPIFTSPTDRPDGPSELPDLDGM